MDDPFGTEVLRRAVLDAWAASAARFREDANAEEDLLRGGYRDRWFTELAQNAADAAARAGATTRLRVEVVDTAAGPELRVGGAGAPLDAEGVASLASLRASAKRDGDAGAVGRFGVGFAAVTAISDAPRLVVGRADGTAAGVAFDRARTAREIAAADVPALTAELARRAGDAPALRLVWPVEAEEEPPPAGVDTEVRLPLRPGVDPDALLALARAEAPDLLLALDRLTGVDVAGTAVTRTDEGSTATLTVDGAPAATWRLVRVSGALPGELRADLAVEERGRSTWHATWAVREPALSACSPGADTPGDVLHAPTPTDERTTLPARLLIGVPLDPDRRHVRAGAVTDHVLAAAGARYPDLVRAVEPDRRADLVPMPALPASAVDATLREAALDALRTSAWLPAADGGADLVPARAHVLELDGAGRDLAARLADVVPGLVAGGAHHHVPALVAAGVTRVGPAELVERLAGLDRPADWWRDLYADLAGVGAAASPARREELAGLPVPLADGRTVSGPRGVLLSGDTDADLVAALTAAGVPGLRVAAGGVADAPGARALLLALGAVELDAAALLGAPALAEAVARSVDDADAGLDVGALAGVVLALVGRGARTVGLGALALPDEEGSVRRADELVLPDGALRGLVDRDGPLGVLAAGVAGAHPREVLVAVGVLDGFAILRDDAPTGPDHDLDDEETWWAEELDPAAGSFLRSEPPSAVGAGPLAAVRDLDLVAADRWPAAWRVLAADREVRETLRARPVRAPGDVDESPRTYTAWWLARHGRLGGRAPTGWRLTTAADLAGLYDAVPAEVTDELDPAFLAAIGVRTHPRVTDPDDAADLLARLADPSRDVEPAVAAAAHAALVAAESAGRITVTDVDPPARVRAADGTVRDADPSRDAPPAVLDRAQLAAVLPPALLVLPGTGSPTVLAEMLDLTPASERVHVLVRSGGRAVPWRRLPVVVAWAAELGRPVPSGEVVLHDRLRVLVRDDERPGAPVEHTPGAWRDDDGVVHADDPVRGLLVSFSRT